MTEAHPAPSPLTGEVWSEGLSGHDKGARAGVPKGLQNPWLFPCRGHDSAHVIPHVSNPLLSRPTFPIPLLSFPTFLIGNPRLFPCRATQIKGQKRKTLDSR